MSRNRNHHHRAGRRSTAGLAALAAFGLTAATGLLSAPSAAATAAEQAGERPPVMIVLDASGSMNADDAPGSRIAAARKAVNGLIADMPGDSKVGLQVFGTGTGNSDAEKTAGCRDIKTIAPVGPLDKTKLTTAVNGITASGYTPIGNALKSAAAALPAQGPRSIVLVSDGGDTCAPPQPCDVARDLKQQGIDLTVHTIGFKVDAPARSQLSCVATATGGTYTDAGDAAALSASVTRTFTRAAAPYRPSGTPVKGATVVGTDEPVLAPGQYLDRLPTGGNGAPKGKPRFYRVPQTPGATTWASATVIGEPSALSDGLNLGVDLVGPDGQSCRYSDVNEFSMGGRTPTVVTAVTKPSPYDPKTWRNCPDPQRVWLKVYRGGGLAADKELPVEIQVRAEPPVDNTAGLPAPFEDVSTPPVPAPRTAGKKVAGGADFNSSPAIGAPQAIRDTIAIAERRIFRIPVRWASSCRCGWTSPRRKPARARLSAPT
ncbi:vWA domain-containing protein [Nakamurella aerolata]|uniref:VWA domain-containing protein n=1 Tax=Nakamurella aerolata TaxID=1656892 RepID=A0A849A3V2_9ACTN|nr:VWA domain-containing protein [Nakamurella aerolata]NNG35694.1 VWA domain-containing protein [Nakamurella aerolata]